MPAVEICPLRFTLTYYRTSVLKPLCFAAALFLHSKQHQDLERDTLNGDYRQMCLENAIFRLLDSHQKYSNSMWGAVTCVFSSGVRSLLQKKNVHTYLYYTRSYIQQTRAVTN